MRAPGFKRTPWKAGPSKAERNTYPSSLRPGRKRAKASLEPPQQEPTLGGKRVQLHSEVQSSYFSSLGIATPSNCEPFRARIWPVLTRENNAIQETLVYSKNQTRPSLPLSMRITGPTEAVWTQDTAWMDLTQRLETELEEKALRYKLTIKTRPQLEWSWVKEPSRGGTECTILAHIDSGTSALSIQNKCHLHWKVLDGKQGMSNEVEFLAPTHNLLMKTEAVHSEHQENKNQSASIQASPQAARKKHYTKLNFATLASPGVNGDEAFRLDREKEDDSQEGPARDDIREPGSFGAKAARSRLNYV
ncbi:unnamed protein product [Sphagnum jensenii]|uniref:Uncharacterized protein n=1 Tax=Sphagnum jensenii TaxID=128206 RepID=A0ABP0W9R3_9BRYO